MLKVGDKIVCIKHEITDLTYGKTYVVTQTRNRSLRGDDKDICIVDDGGYNWWFGQIGYFEPWTMWFVSEIDWNRDKKIEKIINI